MEAVKKERKKRPPSDKKTHLMNCELYLFSIEAAALICGRNRRDFIQDYLEKGFELKAMPNGKFIRHSDLKLYQDQHSKIGVQSL